MEMEISKRVSEILFIPLSLIEPIAGIEGGKGEEDEFTNFRRKLITKHHVSYYRPPC